MLNIEKYELGSFEARREEQLTRGTLVNSAYYEILTLINL